MIDLTLVLLFTYGGFIQKENQLALLILKYAIIPRN